MHTRGTIDETYTITVPADLRAASGNGMNTARLTSQIEIRNTKMDSVLSHLPALYARAHRGNLRLVLHALTREDDRIGGSRDDFLT